MVKCVCKEDQLSLLFGSLSGQVERRLIAAFGRYKIGKGVEGGVGFGDGINIHDKDTMGRKPVSRKIYFEIF